MSTDATEPSGEPFLETVKKRIEALPTAEEKKASYPLWPNGYEESLLQDLTLLKQEAQDIFRRIPPHQRSLAFQILFYKNLQEIKEHTGNSTTPDLLQDLLLAHDLMLGDDAHSEGKIVKFFRSAQALKEYAASQQISTEEARQDLDQKMKKVLPVVSPHLHEVSTIGYDVILKILDAFALSSLQNAQDPILKASHIYLSNLDISLDQDGFESNWIQFSDRFKPSLLSGKAEPSQSSLRTLFQTAKNYIATEESMDDRPQLNLAAVTYEDPNIGFYGNIVSETLNDLQQEARSLHQEGLLGMSEVDIYESLLDREIYKICKIIDTLSPKMPGIDPRKIDKFVAVMVENAKKSQRLERKQNFLFMLRRSASWEDLDLEKITLTTHAIIDGTDGRCPDGQADFFQNWITSYIFNTLPPDVLQNPQLSIKLCLSLLLQNYKSIFIAQHESPFAIGSKRESYDAEEDRTAMRMLLTQMLRLPLGLVGSPHRVLYPYFATRCLEDKENCLQISSMMQRFLKGGNLVYRDLRVSKDETGALVYHDIDSDGVPEVHQETLEFKGFSLKSLGQTLRGSFIESKGRSFQEEALPGLLARPRMSFVFPQEIAENFMQYDPLLASFYATFVDSGYMQGNKFFDAKAAFEEGYHLRFVLKDAALLRFLEVGGYARVPEGFYQNISSDWKFM